MYCSTCELEIKGDDKQTCPICGGALTAGIDAGVPAGANPREQTALDDIIQDINSLIEEDAAPAASGSAQEAVFVLKDYEDDSPAEAETEAAGDAFGGTDVSLKDKLDSIQQSLLMPDSPEPDGAGPAQEEGEDFSFPDTFEPDEPIADDSADDQAAFLNEFEPDRAGLRSANPPQSGRNSVLVLVLLVVLFAGGGYYAYRFFTAGSSNATPSAVRTVTPLSKLKAKQKQQLQQPAEAEKPAASPSALEQPAQAGTQPPAGSAAADARMTASDAGAGPLSGVAPAESQFAVSAGNSGQASDKAADDELSETGAMPAVAKPDVPPADTRAEEQRVAPPAPVQSRPVLQTPAAEPAKRAAAVAAPFYTVHVGSYRSRDTAASEAARISAKGHDAFVERVDLGRRGIWFRVKVGRFTTRAEAESLKVKIHKVLVPDSVVVMNSQG